MNRFAKSAGITLFAMLLAGAGASLSSAVASSKTPSETSKPIYVDIVNAKGDKIGAAMLSQDENGVKIHVKAQGLPPGIHGIHFHETGKCKGPDFKSAGEHYNPTHKQHGFHNPKGFHAGDLPNLTVKEDGTVVADIVSNQVTLAHGQPNSLLRKGGTALVIHAQADDYKTDPAGNSGERIACGVIR